MYEYSGAACTSLAVVPPCALHPGRTWIRAYPQTDPGFGTYVQKLLGRSSSDRYQNSSFRNLTENVCESELDGARCRPMKPCERVSLPCMEFDRPLSPQRLAPVSSKSVMVLVPTLLRLATHGRGRADEVWRSRLLRPDVSSWSVLQHGNPLAPFTSDLLRYDGDK